MTALGESAKKAYRILLILLSAPVVLEEYFSRETGAEYGVDTPRKLLLLARMVRNNRAITTGSTFLEHVVMATKILQIPADVEGNVVECGCYKGGSTANLSLVASLCGRELDVFDSFEGMPAPSEVDSAHTLVESGEVHTYEENSWSASLEEARANVARYGDASVCNFHVGYFDETMPSFEDSCVAIFLDVGLRESAETCLRHLWPALRDGGYLFTHEAKHMEMVTLFFDTIWWRDTMDETPPGLIGGGNGLGLHPGSNGFTSLLAYIVKNPESLDLDVVEDSGTGENCVDFSLR